MAEDMTDKIRSILNNPEMMSAFSSLLGSQDGDKKAENTSDSSLAINIKNAVEQINGGNDKRINLLSALKPYMRDSRASNIDKAIRIIKLTQISSILKDL